MTTATETLRAAGATDVGRQRDVNEDRFHIDRDRRVFMVVDGVGGQAAGGRAADTALEMVRARLARETGPIADRVREAVTIANNEVFRQATARPEWRGMACVLTVAVIDGSRAVIGHVGDTRLYKLRGGTLQKVTPDHSPVGEREDAGELSERDAMHHPRRNEVYRDVGSELHEPTDPEFVDVREIPWEPDAALLICSDGLTDLVPAGTIQRTIQAHAGNPQAVARALVAAANDAGGKDNVTVVYVEGEQFAAAARPPRRASRVWLHAAVWLTVAATGAAVWRYAGSPVPAAVVSALGLAAGNAIVVRPGESIAAAIAKATPGATVVVEPGEYRERLTLKTGVRLVSRSRRAAVLRLPPAATEAEAAVTARDVTNAELDGFLIVGDAATPLGTGVRVDAAAVRLVDLEVTGATVSALELNAGDIVLLASDIHDNPGAGLRLGADAVPLIAHNVFRRNGTAPPAAAIAVDGGARPFFQSNVFDVFEAKAAGLLDDEVRARLKRDNWVLPAAGAAPNRPAPESNQPR